MRTKVDKCLDTLGKHQCVAWRRAIPPVISVAIRSASRQSRFSGQAVPVPSIKRTSSDRANQRHGARLESRIACVWIIGRDGLRDARRAGSTADSQPQPLMEELFAYFALGFLSADSIAGDIVLSSCLARDGPHSHMPLPNSSHRSVFERPPEAPVLQSRKP